jgi:hypothetical protein
MNYAHTYCKIRITIAISYRSFTNPNSEKFEIYCMNLIILVIMYQRMPKRFKMKIKSFFFLLNVRLVVRRQTLLINDWTDED